MSDWGLQSSHTVECPACRGAGGGDQLYRYKPRYRHDLAGRDQPHPEPCRWCAGDHQLPGRLSAGDYARWQTLQSQPVCPRCAGVGGQRTWSWAETDDHMERRFSFVPCSLCQGAGHASPQQLAAYRRELRRLRGWGLGCALVAVIGGLWALSTLLSAVMGGTPWYMCCPPPPMLFAALAATFLIRWVIL